jgi:putative membrane protein
VTDITEPTAAGAMGLRLPHRNLLVYYALQSLVLGPFFFVLLLPRFFKFRSLRYHLEEEGIAAEWGVLFRHEISLGYSRIQDIHLASNLLERWLGLARIQVQTASGSSAAEMTIEGLPDYLEVRDWIYSKMRGAARRGSAATEAAGPQGLSRDAPPDAVAAALREVASELRRVRELLEAGVSSPPGPRPGSAASCASCGSRSVRTRPPGRSRRWWRSAPRAASSSSRPWAGGCVRRSPCWGS